MISENLKEILAFWQNKPITDLWLLENQSSFYRLAGGLVQPWKDGPLLSRGALWQQCLRWLTADLHQALNEQGQCLLPVVSTAQERWSLRLLRTASGLLLIAQPLSQARYPLTQLKLPPALKKLGSYPQGLIVCAGPVGGGVSSLGLGLLEYLLHIRPRKVRMFCDEMEQDFAAPHSIIQKGKPVVSWETEVQQSLQMGMDLIYFGDVEYENLAAVLRTVRSGVLCIVQVKGMNVSLVMERMMVALELQKQEDLISVLQKDLRAVVCRQLIPTQNGKDVIPTYDILQGSYALQKIIQKREFGQIPALQRSGKNDGMVFLDDHLTWLVQQKRIRREDARNRAYDPANFDA